MAEQNVLSYNNPSLWRLVIGVIMILLGLYVWFNPVPSLVALALYIGIAFIVVGAGYIVSSFSYESGWELLVGLLDVLVGIVLVSNLGITAASLPIILAIWCLAVGVIQIVTTWRRGRAGYAWGWSLTIGILSILFAFLILSYPAVGVLTITTIIGLYLVLYGIFSIAEYFYLPRNIVVNRDDIRA